MLGDVHGAHRALVQVLQRANVDRETDRVVCLGDVCDGWPETRECMDELLTLRLLTFVLGNHDAWLLQWAQSGVKSAPWLEQGGRATLASYGDDASAVPAAHRALLEGATHWHQDRDRMFVHGGWPVAHSHPSVCEPHKLMWDRSLWHDARGIGFRIPGARLTQFGAVFIGHTSTEAYSLEPVQACEVWNLDQGAGWSGRLTLMDADTHEYWQSDRVTELYPECVGRAA